MQSLIALGKSGCHQYPINKACEWKPLRSPRHPSRRCARGTSGTSRSRCGASAAFSGKQLWRRCLMRTLGGEGLERLCFQLLVARGEAPRFFGRRGQGQLGADLVMQSAGGLIVYQCKNRASLHHCLPISRVNSRKSRGRMAEQRYCPSQLNISSSAHSNSMT